MHPHFFKEFIQIQYNEKWTFYFKIIEKFIMFKHKKGKIVQTKEDDTLEVFKTNY